MIIILFFTIQWYVGLFCQTFLHHRYAAHSMFTMNKFWERFFYVLSYLSMGSSYISPRAYAIMHRMHHAYADTINDPHSPKYDKNPFNMMWKTRRIYSQIHYGKFSVEEKYKKDLPSWRAFDLVAHSWISRLAWVGLYIYFYSTFADYWWLWILLPITIVMGPFHGLIINWGAHKHGYQNFETENTSKNLMPFDIFMMGEGYHNNHHKFPSRWDFSFKWFEFDATARIIQIFNSVKIIKLKKA